MADPQFSAVGLGEEHFVGNKVASGPLPMARLDVWAGWKYKTKFGHTKGQLVRTDKGIKSKSQQASRARRNQRWGKAAEKARKALEMMWISPPASKSCRRCYKPYGKESRDRRRKMRHKYASRYYHQGKVIDSYGCSQHLVHPIMLWASRLLYLEFRAELEIDPFQQCIHLGRQVRSFEDFVESGLCYGPLPEAL